MHNAFPRQGRSPKNENYDSRAVYTYYAKEGYSGNDLLRAVLNGYTAGETGATQPSEGGYGYSVLFKAYGNTWSSADGTGYDGAYMATGPSGTQYEVGYRSVPTSIPTPDFAVSASTHDVPWGSDSSTADRRILLFVTEDTAHASGIIICQNFVQASPSRTAFPMVLTDVAFAANSANQGSKYCVIAIGGAAVTALSNEKATLHEYTDFSNWEAQGSGAGFIACGTTSGLTNYQNANTYANAAYDNGW